MRTLKTNHGDFTFEPLSFDGNNLMRIRLTSDNEDGERIWVTISRQTMNELITTETNGEYFIAMLCNNALNFEFKSWGMHILCKTNGDRIATADTSWADYENLENRIYTESVEQ
jgi:hypothetical protein